MGVWYWMGFLVLELLGVVSGAHASGAAWIGRRWGHLDLLPSLPDGAGEACRLYCSIPGPLQTVQRAGIWGVLVALQGCVRMHVGVDNVNVVNHVSCIIAGRCAGRPFSLVNDGDLLLKVQQLVRWRVTGNAAVSKVKGHADESLVALGRVREVDRFGMKRMLPQIWVRGVCTMPLFTLGRWLIGPVLVVQELRPFFIARSVHCFASCCLVGCC